MTELLYRGDELMDGMCERDKELAPGQREAQQQIHAWEKRELGHCGLFVMCTNVYFFYA